ncbi:3-hydroxyacyl-CoA dehydrogenase family protein [Bacteriovorax sp. DB6_IX]|uniref:3-hydroxyacyl-CoA dehydrogenase family protein n=1 Tax=Bacteriovorax sp. DB6_IX TaxID=1353530 RepID=UPI00038A2A47|nr:3-hydroxyacyl-CoA dehydrogenase family protein [Bacteriovorax sp. DB6_IX]EQC52491.1 3-hydroxyacyl-CoA dehydrogenase, C-terminal domain protein [Bacteriovorax sp. DB6_IX]
MTINWGEYLLEHYPQISGAFAGAFFSPNKTIEIYTKDLEVYEEATDFFKLIGFELESVNNVGICFNYPRIISMIINEAYFSLEDKMATVEDIDTAMKYGVNYPLGPFEWAQQIGHDKIVQVLDELHQVTGDPRYRASRKLRIHL